MLTEVETRELVRDRALSETGITAQAVYEFWLPRFNTRADVAIIGGEALEAFEIKTARDNLKRLPRQIEAYSHVFDFCSLVVVGKQLEQALEQAPQWWGVFLIGTESHFHCVRPARMNNRIDPETIVRLLWREEAYAALAQMGETPDPTSNRSFLWDHLVSKLDLDALRDVVRQALLTRDPGNADIRTRRFT